MTAMCCNFTIRSAIQPSREQIAHSHPTKSMENQRAVEHQYELGCHTIHGRKSRVQM